MNLFTTTQGEVLVQRMCPVVKCDVYEGKQAKMSILIPSRWHNKDMKGKEIGEGKKIVPLYKWLSIKKNFSKKLFLKIPSWNQ